MSAVLLVVHRVISLLPGIPKGIYPEHSDAVAEESKIGLNQALEYIETVLLKGPNQFLENAEEVSIADLSLVCEIKQLLVVYPFSYLEFLAKLLVLPFVLQSYALDFRLRLNLDRQDLEVYSSLRTQQRMRGQGLTLDSPLFQLLCATWR